MTAREKRQSEKMLAQSRSKNIRQLLLRATRTVNEVLLDELKKRGHEDVRFTHSALLANLDYGGNSLTVLAKRAQMTKQAVGQLAQELEDRKYIIRRQDAADARVKLVRFTEKGWKLMLDSFEIIADIEQRYAQILGEQTMDSLRTGLAAIIGARETSFDAADSAESLKAEADKENE